MLARAHRVTDGNDYRAVVRRGARAVVDGLAGSVRCREERQAPTRFGFIVSKRVGVAVVRNLQRRRLKAICLGMLDAVPTGYDIVLRLPPDAGGWSFEELRERTLRAIELGVARAERRARTTPERVV